jgi:hypothetical protein
MENKEENINKKRAKAPVLTDADAMEVVRAGAQSRFRFCDTFVPRTILYPVAIEYKPGIFTKEIRAFVRQGEFCSSTQWERALQLEKEFPELNKAHVAWLKSQKKPVNIKAPAENATPLGINR